MSYEEKLEYLLWISGLELSIDDLKSCPDEIVADAIICAHLVKNKAMAVGEAHCLMTSIAESSRSDAPMADNPQRINERAFRLGFLYQKIYHTFHSCIAAVGLKIFHTIIKFDGAHFQRLYAGKRFTNSSVDIKILFTQLVNIALSVRNPLLKAIYDFDTETGDLVDDVTASINSINFKDASALESCRVKIGKFYDDSNFRECLRNVDQALKIDGNCIRFLCLKAECLVMLGKFSEADKTIIKALKKNPRDANVLYVQGLKEYYEAKVKESIEKFDAALKIFPDHKKAKERRSLAKKLLNFIYTGE